MHLSLQLQQGLVCELKYVVWDLCCKSHRAFVHVRLGKPATFHDRGHIQLETCPSFTDRLCVVLMTLPSQGPLGTTTIRASLALTAHQLLNGVADLVPTKVSVEVRLVSARGFSPTSSVVLTVEHLSYSPSNGFGVST